MATPASQPSISIDASKDLTSLSSLRALLNKEEPAIFTILGDLLHFATISDAAAAKATAGISLSDAASWTLQSGIKFALTPTAKCTVSVTAAPTPFQVALQIDSPTTTNVSPQPASGYVYVNIALDFDIDASASGSGTVSGVGIAGKVSGSADTTLTFCHPANGSTKTADAILDAFDNLVFPLDPTCAESMEIGSLVKVAFDAALNCEVDVTYGLGDYKVSAPSVAKVQQSLQNVAKITPPSLDVKLGAKGSLTYKHTDHFGLIVSKDTSNSAKLYLVRSSENDWGASVGISAGVTTTSPSVSIDPSALQTAVHDITGSSSLASSVSSAASQPLNGLTTSLNAKLKSWASDLTGQVGLTISLGRQSGHTALFTFDVNLSTADLAEQSWAALVGGSVQDALALDGFTLEAGSGVSDSLKRSSGIQFQFLNLFSFTQTSDYFSQAYTEFGTDGTIRVIRDIGQEQSGATKKALETFRIHFVATATEDAVGNPTKAAINLEIELSEKGNSSAANNLANCAGSIPGNAAVHAAQTAMVNYVSQNPKGTLNLNAVIAASAYGKLAASAYIGKKPSPLPQEQDQDNWKAFQSATETLLSDLGFVPDLSYSDWVTYNRDAVDQVGSTMTPDRRQYGNSNAVPNSFFPDPDQRNAISYFFQAGQGFMNLCDDLHSLATMPAQVDSTDQWNRLLTFITTVIQNDTLIDFTEPILSALLGQCSVAGAQVTTSADLAKDSSSLTCTVNVA